LDNKSINPVLQLTAFSRWPSQTDLQLSICDLIMGICHLQMDDQNVIWNARCCILMWCLTLWALPDVEGLWKHQENSCQKGDVLLKFYSF
jgi:hypothetical protein